VDKTHFPRTPARHPTAAAQPIADWCAARRPEGKAGGWTPRRDGDLARRGRAAAAQVLAATPNRIPMSNYYEILVPGVQP
jgi:hypothetical protein